MVWAVQVRVYWFITTSTEIQVSTQINTRILQCTYKVLGSTLCPSDRLNYMPLSCTSATRTGTYSYPHVQLLWESICWKSGWVRGCSVSRQHVVYTILGHCTPCTRATGSKFSPTALPTHGALQNDARFRKKSNKQGYFRKTRALISVKAAPYACMSKWQLMLFGGGGCCHVIMGVGCCHHGP